MSYDKKALRQGKGYAVSSDDEAFLRPDGPAGTDPFKADNHSDTGYNARFDDAAGSYDYKGHGVHNFGAQDNEEFLRPSRDLADEATESVHQELYRLIDREVDHGSGNKLTGGGGPVSDNVPERDSGGGWGGSGRKGPRFAPKTGPIGNMKGHK